MAEYSVPRPSSQPVGSTELAVAKDNLITYDSVVNAASGTPITNRKGVAITPLIDIIDGAQSQVTTAINNMGWDLSLGAFAIGKEVTASNQVLQYDGGLYRTSEALPYTTDGATPSADSGEWIVVAEGELKAIARSLNVLDSQVIYSTDTVTVLDNVLCIYDASAQVTWGVPSLNGAGETITSVTGSALVTSGGSYNLIDIDLTKTHEFSTLSEMIASKISFAPGKRLYLKSLNAHYDVTAGSTSYPNVSPAIVGGGYAAFNSSNGYITYAQGGAALNGSTIDDTIIQEVNLFAKEKLLAVHQSGGVALLSGSVTMNFIGINCDFTNDFRFKVVTDPTGDVFLFGPEYTPIALNQGDVTLAEFTKSAIDLPSLSAYEHKYCVIKSDDTDLIRVGGQIQKRNNVTVVGRAGELVYPLTSTFASISGITLSPINVPFVEIKGFTLETTGTVDAAYPVKVTRNNVIFTNPRYINNNLATSIAVQQLFSLDGCYNTIFDNPICDSLSNGRVDFNYVISGAYYCKLLVKNLNSFEGWAQVDGNYTRDVQIINSTVDRVGGHFHCYDYTLENIVCNRINPIDLSGGGLLSVNNIKINLNDDYIDTAPAGIVLTRADYGSEWDGAIRIDNVEVDGRGITVLSEDKTFYALNGSVDSSALNHDFGRDLTLPQVVNVSNVTLRSPLGLTQKLSLIGARLGIGTTLGGTISVNYPKKVTVNNNVVDNTGAGVSSANMSVYILGQFQQAVPDSLCNIIVNSCNNDDPRIFGKDTFDVGQITSLYVDGITNLVITSQSIDCDWERLEIRSPNKHIKVRGRSAYIAGTGTVDQHDVNQAATNMTGTWRGAWFGGVVEAYQGIDLTFKQVGFPNFIEDNLTAAKNVLTEVNGALRTATLTIATIESGYKDAAFYQ